MSKPIIEVKGISKRYKLGTIGAQTMRDEVEAFFSRFKKTKPPATSHSLPAASSSQPLVTRHSSLDTARSAEFWALRDVSFDVQPGEVLGIIGRNGAGKSTLLKILSRITEPTSGEIRVRGRIASLLEVGTGFHPELSGRENIFLNGAILGMTKAEIRAKFDEIVDFAGVEQFIDTPVKRYSSGMYVRLAFAVAAHLEPEILIVDEVLAVGDAEFQKKCLGKMKDVAGHGRTILFVSHNMAAVNKLCTNSLLLDQGRIAMFDRTERVLPSYLRFGAKDTGIREWEKPVNSDFWMRSMRIIGNDGEPIGVVDMRQGFSLELDYEVLASIPKFRLALRFIVSDGTVAFTASDCSHSSFDTKEYSNGVYKTKCFIPGNLLNEGTYNITISADIPHVTLLFHEESALAFSVEQTGGINSKFNEKWPGVICPYLEWQTDKK